jgi:hypothetical protein
MKRCVVFLSDRQVEMITALAEKRGIVFSDALRRVLDGAEVLEDVCEGNQSGQGTHAETSDSM